MPTIRSATVSDIPEVVDLWDREGGPTRHAGRAPEAERLLRRDPEALIVAEADGRIIGTLVFGWDGWRCHLYRLAAEPHARRTGVAGALVAEARARAAAFGAARLDAMVRNDNVGAVAFWARTGFEVESHDGRWSALL